MGTYRKEDAFFFYVQKKEHDEKIFNSNMFRYYYRILQILSITASDKHFH